MFLILVCTSCLKLDRVIGWDFIEIFWPLWMYLVLLCALSVMMLIFNIISIKSFIEKKTSLVNLSIGFGLLCIFISYLIFLATFGTTLVKVLDEGKPPAMLKPYSYMLASWFLSVFFFIRVFKDRFMFFLYRSVFIEEPEADEDDIEAQEMQERRKTYQKKSVDVREVPNFVQRFTSTYFKIKPSTKRVSGRLTQEKKAKETQKAESNGHLGQAQKPVHQAQNRKQQLLPAAGLEPLELRSRQAEHFVQTEPLVHEEKLVGGPGRRDDLG
mgnify:CR=1 FL=1